MRFFLHIIRFISRNKSTFLLNFFGITLGLTSTLIIVSVVYTEFNYDSYNKNADQIYRLIQKTESGLNFSTPKPLAPALISELPEIDNAVRFYSWYGYLSCNSENKKLTEKTAIFTDFGFFDMFQIPLESGEVKTAMLDENAIFISGSAANKYFGKINPVGKQLKIGSENIFTVKGVYKDFPRNSNFKGDIIFDISIIHHLTQVYFPDEWDHNSEFSTFIILNEKSDNTGIEQKIFQLHQKNTSEKVSNYKLQNLRNLHVNNGIAWESNPPINVNYLYLLLFIGAMIFIMSLANFIILYITTSRKREMEAGIKMVFGATKKILFFDYLKEVYLMLAGAMLLSFLFISVYNHTLAETYNMFPQIVFTGKSDSAIPFFVVSAFLFAGGLFPALILVSKKRFRIFNSNKNHFGGTFGHIQYLVVTQFALCIFLIISTLVIHKQSVYLTSFDPGYASEELITIPLNMHIGEGIFNEKLEVFCDEMKAHSCVKNISLGFSSPSLVLTSADEADWEGKPANANLKFCWNAIFYNYFETLNVPIIEGREFSSNFPNDFNFDTRESNYILNQTAVKQMGIRNPIGKEFSMYGFKGQIVGIAADFNYRSLHEEVLPMAFNMLPHYYNDIIIRINASDKNVLTHIHNIWEKFVPEYALEISYVSNQINAIYKPERDLAGMLYVFTFIAIIIALLGLITLTLSSTQQRIKEIGIRKINGASVIEIISMLNKDYVKWVGIGFLLAIPFAWYSMSAWLNNFAFRTELNGWIFFTAGLIALFLAIITVSWQSLKAALKNPVDALRYE